MKELRVKIKGQLRDEELGDCEMQKERKRGGKLRVNIPHWRSRTGKDRQAFQTTICDSPCFLEVTEGN